MFQPALRVVRVAFCAVALSLSFGAAGTAAAAVPYSEMLKGESRYAAIVVDANTGEVLYSRHADSPRYPASITKVMTLYLAFEALQQGKMRVTDRIAISHHAASMSPTKLGLRPGQTISVDDAMRAIAVKSSNDIAVAMAEHLGGSESRFAALMTLRAHELGMTNTRFANASGLPDKRQLSSARDIAIMSRAVMRDYPQYYTYFGQRQFTWNGNAMRNHNKLLSSMPGVDGLKTGFTNASGYNLAASAVRNNRRLIAVVLGGRSGASRDNHVEDLLETGFTVMARRDRGERITVAQNLFEPAPTGPVERRSIAQGDEGEGRGLRIVVSDDLPKAPSAYRNIPRTQPKEKLIPAPRAMKLADSKPAKTVKAEAPAKAEAKMKAEAKAKATAKADKESLDKIKQARAEADCSKKAKSKTTKVCKADDVKLAGKDTGKKGKGAKAEKSEKSDKADKKMAKAGEWAVQVGAFRDKAAAKAQLDKVAKSHGLASADKAVGGKDNGFYRARFTGMSAEDAKKACSAIKAKGGSCLALSAS